MNDKIRRPRAFAPGRAIGDAARRASKAASGVNWKVATSVVAKVAGSLPQPGDKPLVAVARLFGAADGVLGAVAAAPYDQAQAVVRRAGGVLCDHAGPLVRAAAFGSTDRGGWPLVKRTKVGETWVLHEHRHPRLGPAWVLGYDASGLFWAPDAWLAEGVTEADVARDLWAQAGGRLRLDVVGSSHAALLGRADGIGRSLSGAPLARLDDLADEQARAARRAEGCTYLFAGAPGCGKTVLAAKLAERAGASLLVVGASALREPGLRALDWADRATRPGVVLLDDVERNLPQDVGALLAWVAGRSSRAGVVTVLACNDVARLPAALWRECRVDDVVFFAPPDAGERLSALRDLCAEYGAPDRGDLTPLVAATEGRGYAALVDVAKRLRDHPVDAVAARLARRREAEAAAKAIGSGEPEGGEPGEGPEGGGE